MVPARRLMLLLLPLALAACGESADPAAPSPAGRTQSQTAAPAVPGAADMAYVTEIPGYTLAPQSVGVYGADGFTSFYVAPGRGQIQLTADRGAMDEATCPRTGIDQAGDAAVRCERDGALWYRTAGGSHEYARAEDGRLVRLTAALDAADRDTLREAAENAHPAGAGELDGLLPEAPDTAGGGTPVERGDLPPGDGAPRDPEGASG